ncbi:MAG: YicC/YloC family endoribonuclease [Verrucomicrobiota bacterium]|nr:YicC/YloC family endoribonuclease [Verrucomicrobiota bacterium]MEC8650468.1 YicC/YloC family endoribonuclease [Verrucomicrobiota bacterium]
MTIKSMTGFGCSTTEISGTDLQITIEISSINRKSLDVITNVPREWSGLDQLCAKWLKPHFQRGRVNIQIKAETPSTTTHGLRFSNEQLEQTLHRLREYASMHNYTFEIDSHIILNLAKSQEYKQALPDWRTLEKVIKETFELALKDINGMRQCEGKALANDLEQRICALEALVKKIKEHASGASNRYSNALLERLKQLNLEINLDDARVLKEIALFADRADISEELTRLNCHLEQFRELISSNEVSGRKMDFLCQEIHRELNTTGSKSTQIEITRAVIEGKNELERIREQVQNIE